MKYLAHIAEDGREQTVDAHLAGTAALAERFASEFHAADHGKLVGSSHDIGKYTEEFQRRLHGGPKVDHATAGAIECAKLNCAFDACTVIGHHSGLPDFGNITVDGPGDHTFCGRVKNGIAGGIAPYDFNGKLSPPASLPDYSQDFLSMSFWIRMLYSCLVDADYLDTEKFMTGENCTHTEYDSIEELLQRLEKYIEPWWNPKNELNEKRCRILRNCLDSGAKAKGLYSLTVPTGGGKTVASLAFALRHAAIHGMKRIIYVIPYTSIIEQNAAVFKKILGDKNVVEHHSNLVFDPKQETTQEIAGKLKATENWDAPVIVTTAVQFFESIYANRSSKCRKLHNLCNSVIIFDEAQMIPNIHLKPCVAAIGNLVSHFEATAVLCTATQPVLGDLFREFTPDLRIEEICPDSGSLYEQFRRVSFEMAGKLSNEELAKRLSLHSQVLCIVNSRKSAQEIYEQLPREGSYHLSTLMYPAHRQRILQEIRQRLKEDKPCRVVSTSLIEAGVDVDFPAVYREKAGLDSILQAAGRCNREGKRPPLESVVSIFEGENPAPPLFRVNVGACTEALGDGRDPADPETVKRYFSSLRSLIGDNLDKYNIVSILKNGISGCLLPFETAANRFHLIDSDTYTIYIPLEEGKAPIRRILEGTASRSDYRKAGRYGVSVYEKHYEALKSAGVLKTLEEDSAVLTDLSLYREDVGLSLNADTGSALFV